MNNSCLSCDIIAGRKEVPGGIIHQTKYWAVEHSLGPLPVGTLIVKPKRHVLTFPDLTDEEAAEYGPLLHKVSRAVKELAQADQVYLCLWSHVDYATGEKFAPGHIHVVVQPAWNRQREQFEKPGPFLQADMFAQDRKPPQGEVEEFAEKAREKLNGSTQQ